MSPSKARTWKISLLTLEFTLYALIACSSPLSSLTSINIPPPSLVDVVVNLETKPRP